ncbi:MAG: CRTAC1 family protein, partial [Planctomycetota bacterium]
MTKLISTIGYSLSAAAVLFAGCRLFTPRRDAQVSSMSKTVARFNRGAALMEQYSYVKAAKTFERVVKAQPEWTAARFNLGLAYYNMQEDKGAEQYLAYAQEAFETVLDQDPNNLSAQFCLGLYHMYLGKSDKAIKYLEAVYRADSADPYVVYKYSEALINIGQNDEGVKILEKVIEIDPGFVSAVYRLALQYQRMRQRDKAMELFNRFTELKTLELTSGSFTVLQTYGTIGKYYTALDADNLPISRVYPETRLLFSPEVENFDNELLEWECPGGTVKIAGIAAGDTDGDGDIDLCIGSIGEDASTSLWLNDGSGGFSQAAVLCKKGISPCFGDVDNDGDLDLWLGRAGEDFYFENDGKGNLQKAEAEGISGGELLTSCSRLVDFDSDGDLDFLAFRQSKGAVPAVGDFEPAGGELYNNNRDGTYTDMGEKLGLKLEKSAVAAVVYDDFDNDRDLDFVIFGSGGDDVIVWVNDRAWKYHILDAETAGLAIDDAMAATSGDPDEDGDRDLLIFAGKKLHLMMNQGGFRFAEDKAFADSWGALGGTSGQFADMDNDGDLDIVIADTHRGAGKRGPAVLINDRKQERFVDATISDPGNLLGAITFEGNAGCIAADLTGNGRCDIFVAPMGRKPFLIENITAGNHWIEIDLLGTRPQDKKSRSNNSAVGARVEIKTGAISQQHVVGIPSGVAAMPPYRIHGGIGKHKKIDWLRIMWPDAVLQAELEVPGDQLIKITELNRKTASCPHLFAWEGSHFELISDFGGMGGLGYLLAPETYARPDPTEYVPVPVIQPLDGEYVLQIIEPIEETAYVDEAKLLAVDHPVDTEVY